MNALFEKNMEVLEKRYPDLAKRIRKRKDNPCYKLIRSKKGNPNVLIKRGSDFFTLYDNNDPIGYCNEYLESLDMKYAPIVVFMGLGLGYHLDRYFKLLGEKLETRCIIIFEKDMDIFRLVLRTSDFRQVLSQPKIHFFVGEKPSDTFVRLRTGIFPRADLLIAIKSLKIIPLPVSISLDNSYYSDILKTVKDAAKQTMVLIGNDSLDSFLGLENLLKNVKHAFSNPGINELRGAFKGKPGVLVSTGPSLNKNMHLLKDIRDKAFIVSCDSSLKPLMNKDIRPHLVVSMERTPGTDLFYSGIRNFKGIYLAGLPILMPEVFDVFKGRKFIIYRGYSHFNWLENDKGSFNVGISVANLCFHILVHLGCDPVILIGQDLAYAEDGDTHAAGNVFGSRDKDIIKRKLIELEGKDGKPVKSERMWEIMKYTFEEDIAAYNGLCINATEGGAKISGAKVMPFKEAIRRFCTEEFRPHLVLDTKYTEFKNGLDIRQEMAKIQSKSKESLTLLEEAIKEFRNALNTVNQVEESIIRPFMEKGSGRIDITKLTSIEKRFLDLSHLISKDIRLWALMKHTLNAYDTCFSNELGFLRDMYSDEECLSMARAMKIKDWFSVVGMFLVLTKDLLEKTEKDLHEEIAA